MTDIGPYDDPEKRPFGERCVLGFGSTAGPPAKPVLYNNLKRIVQTDSYVMIRMPRLRCLGNGYAKPVSASGSNNWSTSFSAARHDERDQMSY